MSFRDLDLKFSAAGWTGTGCAILREAVIGITDDGDYGPVAITADMIDDQLVFDGTLIGLSQDLSDEECIMMMVDGEETLIPLDAVTRFRA